MTLKKIDYSKLVVYKIVCNDLRVTDLYVGSTTNFDQRKKQHKSDCNKITSEKYHYQLYECIRKFGGWQNWSMIIVERCPCGDSYEARKLERFYCEQLNANLNMVRPLCTEEELKQEAKERKQKESYKEKAREYSKCYRKNHVDEVKEKRKQYQDEHKEELKEKRKETLTCSCGTVIAKGSKLSHERSFKHISKSQTLFHS
jgi:hypothetical protein